MQDHHIPMVLTTSKQDVELFYVRQYQEAVMLHAITQSQESSEEGRTKPVFFFDQGIKQVMMFIATLLLAAAISVLQSGLNQPCPCKYTAAEFWLVLGQRVAQFQRAPRIQHSCTPLVLWGQQEDRKTSLELLFSASP